MKEKKQSDLSVLLGYAGSHRGLTFLGLALSAVAMILGMAPYVCIWLAARDLIAVAPDWTRAVSVGRYGWLAFGGIVVYFCALMCTHLMKAPLGFFDSNASGLLRNRLEPVTGRGDEWDTPETI